VKKLLDEDIFGHPVVSKAPAPVYPVGKKTEPEIGVVF
jgi:hypothetical protein